MSKTPTLGLNDTDPDAIRKERHALALRRGVMKSFVRSSLMRGDAIESGGLSRLLNPENRNIEEMGRRMTERGLPVHNNDRGWGK